MAQKAIIVGVNTTTDILFQYEMEELRNLCLACDIEVVDELSQYAQAIHPKTYIRKGKIDEVKLALEHHEADVVVFNDELTPSQIANLEEALEITIYDRTFVILEIFKSRAKTKEAILQVDIASLRYMLPRLIGLRQGLSRQRGVGGGGARGRGQGETQLEIDRRNIADRIALLKQDLNLITKERALQRKKRLENELPIVSLVGYTNSGKSSTLNAILNHSTGLKKTVIQKDMLFATLETSSRLVKLPNNHSFVLTDTVGFVRKLPHHLIEAFKSTLEEIKESTLIVHVVDSANPNFQDQIETTNQVLSEIGVIDIPMLYVFNKIDCHDDYFYIPSDYPDAIRISATQPYNIDRLIASIETHCFDDVTVQLSIPYPKGELVHQLKEKAHVLSLEYLEHAIVVNVQISKRMLKQFETYLITS